MRKLIELAFHRRGLMMVAFCFIAAIGYYSWKQLSIDAYPDIADVTVQVITQVPGLAAEEIEQQITIPIERALNGLPGTNATFFFIASSNSCNEDTPSGSVAHKNIPPSGFVNFTSFGKYFSMALTIASLCLP